MKEEPIYVDDPWEDDDTAWRFPFDLPKETLDLVEKAFHVTGRSSKTFRKPAEKRKWVTITGKIVKGLIPREWVLHCIEFAKKQNSGMRYGVRYTFETLTKYIQNSAAMTDWQAKNPEVFRKPGKYELPD